MKTRTRTRPATPRLALVLTAAGLMVATNIYGAVSAHADETPGVNLSRLGRPLARGDSTPRAFHLAWGAWGRPSR